MDILYCFSYLLALTGYGPLEFKEPKRNSQLLRSKYLNVGAKDVSEKNMLCQGTISKFLE